MSGPLQDFKLDLVHPEPGQAVVVTVAKLPRRHIIEEIAEQLKRSFPDNRCVVMEEGTSLSVEDQLRDPMQAEKLARVRGHLQGYADVLSVLGAEANIESLVKALREDAEQLEQLGEAKP